MNQEFLQTQEFILSIIHSLELGFELEGVFFQYLEGFQPNIYEKIYPLYLAENNFSSALEEGLKHTTNSYVEHAINQVHLFAKNPTSYQILEDTLVDLEHI